MELEIDPYEGLCPSTDQRPHTDLRKIAGDLRQASWQARRAAMYDPLNRDDLYRKAEDLEHAAERIEREAEKRAAFVAFNAAEG